jgi:hypothetical protein
MPERKDNSRVSSNEFVILHHINQMAGGTARPIVVEDLRVACDVGPYFDANLTTLHETRGVIHLVNVEGGTTWVNLSDQGREILGNYGPGWDPTAHFYQGHIGTAVVICDVLRELGRETDLEELVRLTGWKTVGSKIRDWELDHAGVVLIGKKNTGRCLTYQLIGNPTPQEAYARIDAQREIRKARKAAKRAAAEALVIEADTPITKASALWAAQLWKTKPAGTETKGEEDLDLLVNSLPDSPETLHTSQGYSIQVLLTRAVRVEGVHFTTPAGTPLLADNLSEKEARSLLDVFRETLKNIK